MYLFNSKPVVNHIVLFAKKLEKPIFEDYFAVLSDLIAYKKESFLPYI